MNDVNLENLTVPPIGLVVVGDEILSGLRQDKHIPAVIERLKARGLDLSWVTIAGDDREFLVDVYRRSFSSNHIVFSCGGIGGTPDDHTRQAAAKALDRPIVRHPEAVSLIAQRCEESGQPLDEFRLRMADFPADASLIPNPYNRIAGFSVNTHHFVPGFPVMAWPMIEWVLDTLYPHLHHQNVETKRALRLFKQPEARITPVMESLEAEYPGVRLYSLPSVGDDKLARHIELGVKARGAKGAQLVEQCFAALLQQLNAIPAEYELLAP